MASLADRVSELYAQPASLDPEDYDHDGLDDGTVAKRKKRKSDPNMTPGDLSQKGRLRMIPDIPEIEKYKGKKVSRKEVFDAEVGTKTPNKASEAEAGTKTSKKGKKRKSAEVDDMRDEPSEDGDLDAVDVSAGGFSISHDLDKEYERLMQESKQELEVMRQPSAETLEKKSAEAQLLRRRIKAWNTVVELRIHAEGMLTVAHQMPVGDAHGALEGVPDQADQTAKSIEKALAGLLGLQAEMAGKRKLVLPPAKQAATEAEAWSCVEDRLQPVLSWSLGVADGIKEQTKLDVRRGFKVLDQSFATQMQALQDSRAEKLRGQSMPPPGKHAVFGAPAAAESGDGQEAAVAAAGEIFDDRDFYVQLLREVLAGGSEDVKSSATADLQAELQGRRSKKPKKEVEKHASKGKKVRYIPIEKLQNFMSPVARLSKLSEDVMGEQAMEVLIRSMFKAPV